MDNRHSIGSKIQKYRKLKDMTQDELSKQSGIYLSTMYITQNSFIHLCPHFPIIHPAKSLCFLHRMYIPP